MTGEKQPFEVKRELFSEIITSLIGRQYGADRRINVRTGRFNMLEIQYTTLLSVVDSVAGGSLDADQRSALTLWVAVVLSDATGLVRWGGPIDIIVSRQTERILATMDMIHSEHAVWLYADVYETRVKPGMADLFKFLTDKVGYYDIRTIAERLYIAWTSQQLDVRRQKNLFASRQQQFELAVKYLLKGLPTIPDPLSSLSDLAEFLKITNFVSDVDFSEGQQRAPGSFAEARSFITTIRSIAASQYTKLNIVPTLSLQKLFTVRTAAFASGIDRSELRDITLNYSGSETVRAGEMVTFFGDYKQWSEDPALSSALSTLTKGVMGKLRVIRDIRLEAWSSKVDNMSDVSLYLEDSDDGKRLEELVRVMKAYALAASNWVTHNLKTWVYGLLSPNYLSMSSSDAAFSMRGTTTDRSEVAVSLMLMDKEGEPYIGNPTPFYKAEPSLPLSLFQTLSS